MSRSEFPSTWVPSVAPESRDPQTGTLRRMELTNNAKVVGVAFAPDGLLWVASADTLYVERDSALAVAHRFAEAQQVTAIAGASRGVWVGIADSEVGSGQITLGLVRDWQLQLQSTPPALAADARLLGSKRGDVWTLAANGALSRYESESGGGRDLALWREKLPPAKRQCAYRHDDL